MYKILYRAGQYIKCVYRHERMMEDMYNLFIKHFKYRISSAVLFITHKIYLRRQQHGIMLVHDFNMGYQRECRY